MKKTALCFLLIGIILLVSAEEFVDPNPYFLIKVGKKYGYIDRTGKVVIEPKYPYAGPFYDGRAYVSIREKYSPYK